MPDRVALYLITHEDFLRILQSCDGRTPLRVQGLPDSPELLDFWASGMHHGGVVVKVRSPEHKEVPDGEEIPCNSGLLFVVCRPTSPPPSQVASEARAWVERHQGRYAYAEAFDIVRLLTTKLEESVASDASARHELAQVKLILGDYRQDADDVSLAYQQGWREAMAQRDLKDGKERKRTAIGGDATISSETLHGRITNIRMDGPNQLVADIVDLAEAVDATPEELIEAGITPPPEPERRGRIVQVSADWPFREIPLDTARLEEAGRRAGEEYERRVIERILGEPLPSDAALEANE